MKFLKSYEIYIIPDDLPKKGDYVIIRDDALKYLVFLKDKIGKIENYVTWNSGGKYYKTQYNVHFDVNNKNIMSGTNSWFFDDKDILTFSENKKDLEIYINTKKYNI